MKITIMAKWHNLPDILQGNAPELETIAHGEQDADDYAVDSLDVEAGDGSEDVDGDDDDDMMMMMMSMNWRPHLPANADLAQS